MAHDEACIGTWRNNTLGGQPDGDITIFSHTTNQIKGRHHNSGTSIKGTCTGSVQNFSRDLGRGRKRKYKNGRITRVGPDFKINGTFEDETTPVAPTAGKRETKGKKAGPPPPDEWEGEKTGA